MGHLRQVLGTIIEHRSRAGLTSNARTLRLWIEHAKEPFRLLDGVPCVLHRNWFSEVPEKNGDYNVSCWISPGGQVWPIGYAHHYTFSTALYGEDTAELEKEGWLHISDAVAYVWMPPNERQQRALDELTALVATRDGRTLRLDDIGVRYPDWRPNPDEGKSISLRELERSPRSNYDWTADAKLAEAVREDEATAKFLSSMDRYRGVQPIVREA